MTSVISITETVIQAYSTVISPHNA